MSQTKEILSIAKSADARRGSGVQRLPFPFASHDYSFGKWRRGRSYFLLNWASDRLFQVRKRTIVSNHPLMVKYSCVLRTVMVSLLQPPPCRLVTQYRLTKTYTIQGRAGRCGLFSCNCPPLRICRSVPSTWQLLGHLRCRAGWAPVPLDAALFHHSRFCCDVLL